MFPSRDSRALRLLLTIFFALAAAYGLYEAQGLLWGPVISLPADTYTSHEAFTTIRGQAERITELRLNGRPISVTEDGAFNEPYLLAPGSNHILLEARDARGRTASATLDIVYIAPPALPQAEATSSRATTTPATEP